MNQRGFTTIVWVVVVVVLVGAIGYFVVAKKPNSINQQSTPASEVSSADKTPTEATASNEEATSLTVYNNTKYNYSFRYPKNFTMYTAVDQTKETVTLPTAVSDKVFLTNNKAKLFCCEPLVTSVSVVDGSTDSKNWRQYVNIPDYRIKSQGEITFAGRKAFEVRGSAGLDSAGARLILIPGSQFSFVLIQGDEGEPWESITNSFSFK